MPTLNDRDRRALRPTAGGRLLLELDSADGARARYLAWLLTADDEHAYTAELDDGGASALTAVAGATEGADELLMLARLTARGARKRVADGLPAWPPRILRWRGPGRGG